MTPGAEPTPPLVRRLRFETAPIDPSLEWLVTNGLGGYASAPVGGGLTRRQHGVLIAALPAPFGRIVMVNHLRVTLVTGDARVVIDHESLRALGADDCARLAEFRLESGLPIWEYVWGDFRIEKRVMMPHRQNTTHVAFRLLSPSASASLEVLPLFHARPHEEALSDAPPRTGRVTMTPDGAEIALAPGLPPLLMRASAHAAFSFNEPATHPVQYVEEKARGYADAGDLWTPGPVTIDLSATGSAALTMSTEGWPALNSLSVEDAAAAEASRRQRLIDEASAAARTGIGAELTLAADQFIICPATRAEDAIVAEAAGEEARTVIAGYHWFTDWGRDTMISLEGLTMTTGRLQEAGDILNTFGHHVQDGLIPNMFPEGKQLGLYHTADATLWFFHATDRYVSASGDRVTLRQLLPTFVDIAEHHIAGTRFGIGVDPTDLLLRQGADGYQLTWMDAKVDGWVVTPRRGKAVEINALWYQALRLLSSWLADEGQADEGRRYAELADHAAQSFNRRFWNAAKGYLFDVVDGETGDDDACRPNQLFAVSLPHAVLDRSRWAAVLDVVRSRLLTPVGLRSLAAGHPDYRARYYGDLRARDAAYHQGTVWAWLIGPYVDAWLKVHPYDRQGAREALLGFLPHLDQACVGSVSEIFDAESPFTPRGCVAQAWSVAELLRSWVGTA